MTQSFILSAILSVFAFSSTVRASGSEDVRNVSEYNLLEGNIGLKGYDPVSVFSEAGGVPLAGSSEISIDYKGVIYFFANTENLKTFAKNPNRFEPTYGGWCAYAMALNQKFDIDVNFFTISKNRAHFFPSAETKSKFDANIPAFERRADNNWKKISGESPRK